MDYVYVQVVFKNCANEPLTLTRMTCSFQPEPGVDAKAFATSVPLDIEPGGRSEPAIIQFTVDLSIASMTNYVRIEIEYATRDGVRRTATFDQPDTNYMVPLQIDPTPKSQLFISHKIPFDTCLYCLG